MSQTIKLKNSGSSGNTPSSLAHGELAINYADGKIFYKNSSNNIVEFSSSGSFLPLSGGTLTGNLSIANGGVGSPAIRFASDTDTGIYRGGADNLIIATGGANRLTVTSAGIFSSANVYSGTTGAYRNFAGTWAGTTGTANNGFYFLNTANSNTTKAMDLSHDGNVVFAGEIEGSSLDINGLVDIDGNTRITGSSGTGFALEVERGDNSADVLLAYNNGVVQVPNNYLYASRTGGASFYSEGAAVFRGGILNDQSGQALTVSDDLNIAGAVKINTVQILSSSRALSNVTGNISMFTNDSGYITSSSIPSSLPANGGNADTVDSLHASSFLRSDAADTASGALTLTNNNNHFKGHLYFDEYSSGRHYIHFTTANSTNQIDWRIQTNNANSVVHQWSNTNAYFATQVQTATQGILWGASNDGSGSGLDADTVDTLHASSFLRSDASDTYTSGTLTFGSGTGFDLATFDVYGSMRVIRNNKSGSDGMYIGYLNTNSGLTRIFGGGQGSGGIYVTGSGANDIKYNNSSTFWHAGNDGSGSGLDADTLDGYQSGYFATQGNLGAYLPLSGGTMTGTLKIANGSNSAPSLSFGSDTDTGIFRFAANHLDIVTGGTSRLRIDSSGGINSYNTIFARKDNVTNYTDAQVRLDSFGGASSLAGLGFHISGQVGRMLFMNNQAKLYWNSTSSELWHASNDGSGSGLDSDLLDGQHGAYYLNYNHLTNTPSSLPANGGNADTVDNLHANNSSNTAADALVRTQANGYIFSSFLNTTSGDAGTTTPTRFYASYDNYIRYYDWISMKSFMNSPYSRNLWHGREQDGTSDTNYHTGSIGWGSTFLNDTTAWDVGSGFLDNWSQTGANSVGSSGSHFLAMQAMHYSAGTSTSRYGFRIINQAGTSNLYFQRTWNSGVTTHRIWNAGTDGSGSGLDADTLDGIDSGSFLRSDANDSYSGVLTLNGMNFPNTSNTSRNLKIQGQSGNDVGISGFTSDGSHAFQIYGTNSNYYGFLDSNWGNWDLQLLKNGHIKKRINGSLATVWNSANDGSGSGLDADTVDGVQLANIARTDVAETFTSHVTVNNNLYIGDGNDGYFFNDTNGRTAFANGQFYFQNTVNTFYNYAPNQYHGDSSGTTHYFRSNVLNGTGWSINGAGKLNTRDHQLNASYVLMRSDHHSGHLEGSYNNVGANDSKTNPIYTIGSSYNPNDSTLGNMYGVGYTHTNASFINFSGISDKWGLYVAADGDARVFLDGSNGTIVSTGQHYVGSSSSTSVVWNAGNDGSGSGLDADLLDGLNSATSGSSVIVKTQSNGYLAPLNWIQIGSGTGLFNSNGAYFFENTTYGWNSRSRQNSNSSIRLQLTNGSNVGWFYANSSGTQGFLTSGGSWRLQVDNTQGNSLKRDGSHKIWDAGNDGSGSGLDADTVDGLQASQFLRSDADDSVTGLKKTTLHQLRFTGVGTNSNAGNDGYAFYQEAGAWTSPFPNLIMGYHTGVKFGAHKSYGGIRFYNDHPYTSSAAKIFSVGEGDNNVRIQLGDLYFSATTSNKAWHAGNDGSGSGLDADLLDGYDSAENGASKILRTQSNGYLNILNWINVGNTGLFSGTIGNHFHVETNGWISKSGSSTASHIRMRTYDNNTRGFLYANSSNYIGFLDPSQNWIFQARSNGNLYKGNGTGLIWHSANDGSGSGLDADTVDGVHASSLYGVTSVATGGGLTGGTITSTGTISHADTSSVSNVNNSGNTFIQDITFDTYGHVTSVTSATATSSGGGGASSSQTVTARVKANRLDYIAATSPATIYTATSGKVIVLEEAICFIDADAVSASGYPVFGYPIRVRVKSQWNNSSDAYIHRDGGMTFTKEALNSLFRSNSQSANYSANMKRFLVAQPRDPTANNPDQQQQIAEVNSSDGTFNSKIELTMDSYVNTSTSEDYYFYFQVKFREVTLSDITGASGMVTI